MLKVRLQRTGKRGQAYFRVVVLEHTKKPKGKFLELLGNYDPHKKEFKVNMERINHWLSNGAQVSPTVNNLLVNYKYWDRPKVASWKPKKKKKTDEGKEKPSSAEASPSTPPSSKTSDGRSKVSEDKPAGKAEEKPPESKPAEEPKPAVAENSSELKQEEAKIESQPDKKEEPKVEEQPATK